MKIIFSRKGFDSTAGGFASPIFPDGTLFSIPIPSSEDNNYYSELSFQYDGDSIQSILNEITGGRIKNNRQLSCDFSKKQQRCHYDPMLISHADRFVLGQAANAESHLQNQSVGSDDIFVFYGWFRQVEKIEGCWQYSPIARDIQLIWSWMKIGDTVDVRTQAQREKAKIIYPFLHLHPHVADSPDAPNPNANRVYISKEGGLLPYLSSRCLTDCIDYQGRSTWRLPACFNQPKAFTFLNNFVLNDDNVIISFRGYGQEFVLDLEKVDSENNRTKILAYLDQNIFGLA